MYQQRNLDDLRKKIGEAVHEEAEAVFKKHFPTMLDHDKAEIVAHVESNICHDLKDERRAYIHGADYEIMRKDLMRYAERSGYMWQEEQWHRRRRRRRRRRLAGTWTATTRTRTTRCPT